MPRTPSGATEADVGHTTIAVISYRHEYTLLREGALGSRAPLLRGTFAKVALASVGVKEWVDKFFLAFFCGFLGRFLPIRSDRRRPAGLSQPPQRAPTTPVTRLPPAPQLAE